MTKGKKKRRGGKDVKEKPPEVKSEPPEIANNKSDVLLMEHMSVKEKPPELDIMRNYNDVMELKVEGKPPDYVVCDPYCGKCKKVKPYIDNLRKHADKFVEKVIEERKSLGKLEVLLIEDKRNEAIDFWKKSIITDQHKLNIMEKIVTKLINEMAHLDICRKQWNLKDIMVKYTERYMRLFGLIKERLEEITQTITLLLEVIQLQEGNFDLLNKEVQRHLSGQIQQEMNEDWEYASRLKEKQPKVMKILEKAELVFEVNKVESIEDLKVVNIKDITVEVIQKQRVATSMEDLFKRKELFETKISKWEEDMRLHLQQIEINKEQTLLKLQQFGKQIDKCRKQNLLKLKQLDSSNKETDIESSLKDVSKWNTAKQEYLQDNMEVAK